jgi:hypothetical protein
MKKRYSAGKESSFGIFLLAVIIIITVVSYGFPVLLNESYSLSDFIIPSLIDIPLIFLILWCWLDTYYLVDNGVLIARCGPFIRKISINEIILVRLNQKTIYGIWKPTLSWKSIEVKYSKYKSVYITPEKQDEFLSGLKNINSKIEIFQN